MSIKTPFKLLPQLLRILEHRAHISPNRRIQTLHAQRLVRADCLSTEPLTIHASATVIRIGLLRILLEARETFAVIRITAATAFQQALQKVVRLAVLRSQPGAVFGQLCHYGVEQVCTHNRGDRNRDSLLWRTRIARHVKTRLRRRATHGSQMRDPLPHARLAENRLAFIGGIPQQFRDRLAVPAFSLGTGSPFFGQTAADLPNR